MKIARFVVSYIGAHIEQVRRSVSLSSDSLLVSLVTGVHAYLSYDIVSRAQVSE